MRTWLLLRIPLNPYNANTSVTPKFAATPKIVLTERIFHPTLRIIYLLCAVNCLFSIHKTFYRKFWSIASLVMLSVGSLQAGEIMIAGIYQGKNLFVQNPLSPDNKNYCVDEVYINDRKAMANVKVSAFEVDLSELEIDDPVTIRITHKDGCAPKIINPQVIRPSGSFQIHNVVLLQNTIRWSASGETPPFVYYVENLNNGNWIVLKRIAAQGEGEFTYSTSIGQAEPESKYRIKAQNSETHQTFYSKTVVYDPTQAAAPIDSVAIQPVTFLPKKPTHQLILSREAEYEIIDSKKKVIAKGKKQTIDIKPLKAGTYYLKVNNQLQKFIKK